MLGLEHPQVTLCQSQQLQQAFTLLQEVMAWLVVSQRVRVNTGPQEEGMVAQRIQEVELILIELEERVMSL